MSKPNNPIGSSDFVQCQYCGVRAESMAQLDIHVSMRHRTSVLPTKSPKDGKEDLELVEYIERFERGKPTMYSVDGGKTFKPKGKLFATPKEPSMGDDLESVLDAHAEYYIRQTMRFFQSKGPSPALSRNNEGDLAAKVAIQSLISTAVQEAEKKAFRDGWAARSCEMEQELYDEYAKAVVNRAVELLNQHKSEE